MQLVRGHGCRLLQLLLDLDLASSQDSSIRAAILQLTQELLAPQTCHQLLAGGSSPAASDAAAAAVAAGMAHAEGSSEVEGMAAGLLEQLLAQLPAVGGGDAMHQAGGGDAA